ncbi:unnamed protein product [Candida verbasci]|uniref:C2 domain-containing protein n=1 Tax=Candida verbasci TaxID=1227364 RepID=A0A9W4TY82_9ASCO|nr:unnamed protein product [Candida verbasci]
MSSKNDLQTRPYQHKRLASSTSTSILLNGSNTCLKTNLSDVDKSDLYKNLLKIILLEYSNEARFRTPIIENTTTNKPRFSMLLDSNLPNYVLKELKIRLQKVMFDEVIDKNFRRTLLRLFSQLPSTGSEYQNMDFIITKFASFANLELKNIGITDDEEIKKNTFKQTISFIDYLIEIVKSKKDYDNNIITKLNERKKNFESNRKQETSNGNNKYLPKSYRVADLNPNLVKLFKQLFKVDDVQLQLDVFKYKDTALAKPFHKDIKDLESISSSNRPKFQSEDTFNSWIERQKAISQQCINRYKIPAEVQLLPLPPKQDDFYILPNNLRNEYLKFVCMLVELEDDIKDLSKPFLNKSSQDFFEIVNRVWHVDYPTRVVALYLAGLNCEALSNDKVVDIDTTEKLFNYCRTIINRHMDYENKHLWSIEDQDLFVDLLIDTYNQVMYSIKEQVNNIFEKPSFKNLLMFLGILEQDALFTKIEETNIPKKWESKLEKTVLKAANKRYTSYFDELPRDNTSNILHILNICDTLVDDIKKLQKRYKNPLLGFLNVAKVVASLTTGRFAKDCETILIHIHGNYRQRDEKIPYSDGLEIYKSLNEIRDIFLQVSSKGSKFEFDIEKFFFNYLEDWVLESDEKILNIVKEALKRDDYKPINEEMHSQAILDIFTIIKQYLITLKKINWQNDYQLAKAYTILLQSISNGALFYSEQITNKLIKDLEPDIEPETKKNWIEEVKNVVTKRSEPKVVYNFQAETCIALNNISAMMNNLTKLEEWVDPESISKTIERLDVNAHKKYLSHVFAIRIIRGENIRASKDSAFGRISPYVTLSDRKKLIGKTRTIYQSSDPDYDEEFEIKISPNSSLDLSLLVWDERFGQHQVCGRAFLDLDPFKFNNDGKPQEIILDLDLQGKLIIEVALESETLDAMFVLGRAYRSLHRARERSIKLIVEKFTGFIQQCFSKFNLKKVCSKGSPSREEFEESIENLCDYLNMNLSVLKEFLTDENFMKVMVETWKIIVISADELVLPKLSKAKFSDSSWQLSIKFANVLGFESELKGIEIETVLGWLNLLSNFFHNEGNGPPMEELKIEQYQSLLLIPALYDQDDDYLIDEVEKLSPAYLQMLNHRNYKTKRSNVSISRSKTIQESATSRARKKAEKELKEARHDPIMSQNFKEDIILRILITRNRKDFVCRRIEQRNKLAQSISAERTAREAAEKRKF